VEREGVEKFSFSQIIEVKGRAGLPRAQRGGREKEKERASFSSGRKGKKKENSLRRAESKKKERVLHLSLGEKTRDQKKKHKTHL